MNGNPKITIHKVDPTNPVFTDGDDLKLLYFRLRDTGNGYRLYQSDGTKIKTDPHHLESGVDFTFTYDELFWSITDFKVFVDPEGKLVAKGKWSAKPIPNKDGKDDEDPETGTFQAQAGGHPIEVGATASA